MNQRDSSQTNANVGRKSCLQTSPAEQRLLLWHQAAGLRAPWLLALATFQNHKYIQGQPRQQQKPRDTVSKWGETNSPFQACLLPGSWWPRLRFPKVGCTRCPGFRLWGLQAFPARGQLRRCLQPRSTFSGGCGTECLGKAPQYSLGSHPSSVPLGSDLRCLNNPEPLYRTVNKSNSTAATHDKICHVSRTGLGCSHRVIYEHILDDILKTIKCKR